MLDIIAISSSLLVVILSYFIYKRVNRVDTRLLKEEGFSIRKDKYFTHLYKDSDYKSYKVTIDTRMFKFFKASEVIKLIYNFDNTYTNHLLSLGVDSMHYNLTIEKDYQQERETGEFTYNIRKALTFTTIVNDRKLILRGTNYDEFNTLEKILNIESLDIYLDYFLSTNEKVLGYNLDEIEELI